MTKVLVVDDEKDIRELLIDDLLDSGYQVIEAENGAEALDRVYNDRPDIVLLDLMMPVMNGFEVLKTLKSNPDTSNLPVLLLTAVSADEAEQSTMDLGANHYVTKPWEPGTIQTMITVTLREAAKGEEKSAAGPGREQANVADLVGEETNEADQASDRMNEANWPRNQVDSPALISTEDRLFNVTPGGGVPCERLTFIDDVTATGKSVLCQRFTYTALMQGHGVSYFRSLHSPSSLISQMASLGMNSSHFYSSGQLMVRAIPNVDASSDCTEALFDQSRQVKELATKFRFVIMDVISSATCCGQETAGIGLIVQCNDLGDSGKSIVIAAHPGGMSGDVINRLRSLSDSYLALRVEKNGAGIKTFWRCTKSATLKFRRGARSSSRLSLD